MIARMVLPQFGGGPAVWNTCMVFFQAALLAGYGYVHATSVWLGSRGQARLHMALFALPIAVLPIAVHDGAAGGEDPALRLLSRLLVAAGLPFIVVATTAPLLQRWFAATGHRRAGDPYFLYAASNTGSLLALIGYVTVLEPNLTLRDQARFWAVGYGLLAVLTIACEVALWRAPAPSRRSAVVVTEGRRISVLERVRWAALAFVPSSLLLGVTAYLTTDLASVPLFWLVPLAIYLLSFVIAFANPPAFLRRGCALALPPAIVVTLAMMILPSTVALWATFLVHLATFFVAALACHVELAHDRPQPGRLTEFYLMISLGGAVGGLFNALIAPVMFTWVAEYPLGLALAALLVPAAGRRAAATRAPRRVVPSLDVVLPMLLGGASYAVPRLWGERFPVLLLLVSLVACLLFVMRPLRFALGLAVVAIVIVDFQDSARNVVLRERNFFGVLRVSANFPAEMNSLTHGNTLHGRQRRSPVVSERRIPLLYYFPTGPIGQVFEAYQGTPVVRRVGVIGLGVGSLAGYARTGDEYTFFEIDPTVERIARTPAYFHYLDDCRGSWRVVLGDARLSLGREPDGSFGLIVLDAFSGDAIPVHLLTREALRIYLSKLAEGGLIALHISNNYLDLEPALRELARDTGLEGLGQNETTIPTNELKQGRLPSHWVVLARRRVDLARLAVLPGWRPLARLRGQSVWTDSYSDVFSLLRWN
jgi:hypothetical protein